MSTLNFIDMPAFERAIAQDPSLERFTLSLFNAAETLGVSRRYVHQLVRCSALQAVSVAGAYVYLDPEDVMRYRRELRARLTSTRAAAAADAVVEPSAA